MSFMQKLREGFRKLMTGRRGADELSLALLIGGVVLSMLGSLLRFGLLNLLGLACYFICLWRMLSRNLEKRYQENVRFTTIWHKVTANTRQFINRMKNMRKYKYFKCPECHALLRLPRKVGEVTVTCGKCRHAFKQKA